jgi:hypothetical protein
MTGLGQRGTSWAGNVTDEGLEVEAKLSGSRESREHVRALIRDNLPRGPEHQLLSQRLPCLEANSSHRRSRARLGDKGWGRGTCVAVAVRSKRAAEREGQSNVPADGRSVLRARSSGASAHGVPASQPVRGRAPDGVGRNGLKAAKRPRAPRVVTCHWLAAQKPHSVAVRRPWC